MIGAQVQRGFRRLGIASAAILGVGGIAISLVIASEQADRITRDYPQMNCVRKAMQKANIVPTRKYSPADIDLDVIGCADGPRSYISIAEGHSADPGAPDYRIEFARPFAAGILVTAAVSGLGYAAFHILGWILAGFARD